MATNSDFFKLEERLGIVFKNQEILKQALIHRSYLNENPRAGLDHNERLEFLGDAVLELIVTEYLYDNYPNPEGELTAWRAALVNASMLAKIATTLEMNDYLLLSKGEAKDNGKARQFILADALEAVIGAIYLDQGMEATRKFLQDNLISNLPEIIEKGLYRDPKSYFQEKAQDINGVTPAYKVLEEWGPDHAKQFRVGVFLGEELIAEGEGYSKQEAQQNAAEAGLQKMEWNNN